MPDTLRWFGVAIFAWLTAMAVWHWIVLPWLRQGPGGVPGYVIIWKCMYLFIRLVHRVRYIGQEHVPTSNMAGPLLVVSNHTGAVDPMLISGGCPFAIRWMMAEDMYTPTLTPFLEYTGVIPVARDGTDTASARLAVRELKAGAVIGIFPEGGIVTPPRQLWPFFAGVGLIIARSKAPVLLVWVSGTPDTNDMNKSLMTPSHARVQYLGVFDFAGQRDAKAITETLRAKIAEVSGWPIKDGPAVPRLADGSVNGAAAEIATPHAAVPATD